MDSIIGVYEDIGAAMNVSNASQVHLTDVMLHTPGIIGGEGRIWITHDGAGSFSAFSDEPSAGQYLAVNGGRMKSFVLNAAPAAVTASGIQAAERAAIAAGQVPGKAFTGAGTEMSKAAFIAIKDALAKPLSASRAWR